MNNNLLFNFIDVVDTKLSSGQITIFNNREIENTLKELSNNDISYYYSLTTQLNHYLQKINFSNDFLCRVSTILTRVTNQYEYEKLSESDRNIRSVRENLSSAINLLDELHGKMKNEINK